mmetsp:Transcript_38566/g.120753  ORF Transcript_38566/g.120753 Transcript_38566/m.120753 type:complete len:505 (-) Transcript_38566:204-1718(-)
MAKPKACHAEEEPENFWWQRGLFQPPRAVVKWDHTIEGKPSRGIAEPGRKVSYSELFFDLVLVTNISRLGESYQEGHLPLAAALVCYRVLYECWMASTTYASRYYTDDLLSKGVVGALMFVLVLCGLRLDDAFPANTRSLGFFAGVFHLVMFIPNARVWRCLPEYRTFALREALVPCLFKGTAFIAASIYAPEEYILVADVGIIVSAIVWSLIHYGCFMLPKANRAPIHVDHYIERRSCYRLIVFGEVITGVTVNPADYSFISIGLIALGFLLVFNAKLLAFDVDVVPVSRHVMRVGGVARVMTYIESAVIFDGTMGLMGSCVKIVLGTLIESETVADKDYARAESAHLTLCFCVAIGIATLTIERLMHDHGHIFGEEVAEDVDEKTPLVEETKYGSMVVREHFDAIGSPNVKSTIGDIEFVDELNADAIEAARNEKDYNRRLAKTIWGVQMACHVMGTAAATALGIVCLRIDEDFEFLLVLAALWGITASMVVIDLLDEALLY